MYEHFVQICVFDYVISVKRIKPLLDFCFILWWYMAKLFDYYSEYRQLTFNLNVIIIYDK